MKTILTFCFIISFHFSAFAQIDTSAWEGKTVLFVFNDTLAPIQKNNTWIKTKSENWYLTDSICSVNLSVLNRDLNNLGEDTVVILWEMNWLKTFVNTGCMSANPYDCLSWSLSECYTFRNFQNGNWETYIFIFYKEDQSFLEQLQNLITTSRYKPTYTGKTKIIRNAGWSKETENLINQKFQNTELTIKMNFWNEYANYHGTDAIYVYERNYPPTNYIEIVDLETNRVIEKIKIE